MGLFNTSRRDDLARLTVLQTKGRKSAAFGSLISLMSLPDMGVVFGKKHGRALAMREHSVGVSFVLPTRPGGYSCHSIPEDDLSRSPRQGSSSLIVWKF